MKRYTPTQLKEFIQNEIDGINEDIGFNKFVLDDNGYGISLYQISNREHTIPYKPRVGSFEISYNEKSKIELIQFLKSLRLFREGLWMGLEIGINKEQPTRD